MKSKTLAIFGIGAYTLSVMSSAEDLVGNYTAPTALIGKILRHLIRELKMC